MARQCHQKKTTVKIMKPKNGALLPDGTVINLEIQREIPISMVSSCYRDDNGGFTFEISPENMRAVNLRQERLSANLIGYPQQLAIENLNKLVPTIQGLVVDSFLIDSSRETLFCVGEATWDKILKTPFMCGDGLTHSEVAFAFQGHCAVNFGLNSVAVFAVLSADGKPRITLNAVLIAEGQKKCRWDLVDPVGLEFVTMKQLDKQANRVYAFF